MLNTTKVAVRRRLTHSRICKYTNICPVIPKVPSQNCKRSQFFIPATSQKGWQEVCKVFLVMHLLVWHYTSQRIFLFLPAAIHLQLPHHNHWVWEAGSHRLSAAPEARSLWQHPTLPSPVGWWPLPTGSWLGPSRSSVQWYRPANAIYKLFLKSHLVV